MGFIIYFIWPFPVTLLRVLVMQVGGFAVWEDHSKPSTCPHAAVYLSPFGGGTRQYFV